MYMASSMVNEIAPIVLALTDSRAYGRLIIDEIEASLHPQKQLELVRFLNRLSNKGIQLILSTHSDLKTRMQNRRCPGMQGRCFSKEMDTLIFDMKSNISAFSDDLLKDNAMLTAIKEIRDFAEQIHAEILHKNSFVLYYNDDGFVEYEWIGIITKNFEKETFLAIADMLERLFEEENASIPRLVEVKLKNSLMTYKNEAKRIRDFSEKTVRIHEKAYPLKVVLLEVYRTVHFAEKNGTD